jgi:hypothetical protein
MDSPNILPGAEYLTVVEIEASVEGVDKCQGEKPEPELHRLSNITKALTIFLAA